MVVRRLAVFIARRLRRIGQKAPKINLKKHFTQFELAKFQSNRMRMVSNEFRPALLDHVRRHFKRKNLD